METDIKEIKGRNIITKISFETKKNKKGKKKGAKNSTSCVPLGLEVINS